MEVGEFEGASRGVRWGVGSSHAHAQVGLLCCGLLARSRTLTVVPKLPPCDHLVAACCPHCCLLAACDIELCFSGDEAHVQVGGRGEEAEEEEEACTWREELVVCRSDVLRRSQKFIIGTTAKVEGMKTKRRRKVGGCVKGMEVVRLARGRWRWFSRAQRIGVCV